MRKKIEEIIEQSFDVVRIGNKVYYTSKSESDEKFKRRIEELLTLHGVVSSLPSKEEMEIGLETLMAYKEDSFKTEYDKITFKFGFRTCFSWLSKRITK